MPGRTVELELQLRPEPKAPAGPAAASATQVWGVTWLPLQNNWTGGNESAYSHDLGDGRYQIGNGWGILSSIWEGVPSRLDQYGDAWPDVGETFRCVEIELLTSYWVEGHALEYFGVIAGPSMVDARWEFEWDFPQPDAPEYSQRWSHASAFGNVVHVALASTDGARQSRETLTARAFSGGVQVGELRMIAIGEAA